MILLFFFTELEVQRKAGNLKGVPAVPEKTILPEVWPMDSVEAFVEFISQYPPTVCFSDLGLKIKGDSSKEMEIPAEWVNTCPL